MPRAIIGVLPARARHPALPLGDLTFQEKNLARKLHFAKFRLDEEETHNRSQDLGQGNEPAQLGNARNTPAGEALDSPDSRERRVKPKIFAVNCNPVRALGNARSMSGVRPRCQSSDAQGLIPAARLNARHSASYRNPLRDFPARASTCAVHCFSAASACANAPTE